MHNENRIRLAEETAVGMRNAGITFDRAYSSPLKRALKTASIIYEETCTRDSSGQPLHPLITDDRLREFSFGECEGTRIAGIEQDPLHPMFAFLYDPAAPNWPKGGETFEDVRFRFRQFLQEVIAPLEDTCDTILLLSHGGFMREVLDWIESRPRCGYMATAAEFRNCSFYILDYQNGHLSIDEGNRIFHP